MDDSNLSLYQQWAPADSQWSAWAKPVLFAASPVKSLPAYSPSLPTLDWAPDAGGRTAIIANLPGEQGVEAGLALARKGYRPVPLYNSVQGPARSAMVEVGSIRAALVKGAKILAECPLPPNAPPVFLLDENRMLSKSNTSGNFDNRWCVFPQDMPSAAFLKAQGIETIILYSNLLQNDLLHILRRYQQQGLTLYQYRKADDGPLRPIKVAKPSHFKSLFYRFQMTAGLVRNAAGGFGGSVPEPTRSGGRYYGMG